MDRPTALRYQLRIQVQALAAALVRPGADPRGVWRLADTVLDTHDDLGAELHELRGEVAWLMRQIAARRDVDAAVCADSLRAHAAAIPVPSPVLPFPTPRPREIRETARTG